MAQRDRGRIGPNDPCWCGGGKKYKHCHRNRDQQPPLTAHEIHEEQKRARRNAVRSCLAAELEHGCDGRPIESHNVSRAGSLEQIAREGHVYGFVTERAAAYPALRRSGGKLLPSLVGLRRASTFTGFCARHDSEIFRPLDTVPFAPTPEQVALVAFRATACEVFGKRMMASVVSLMREADRGREPLEQLLVQTSADGMADHASEGLPPLWKELRKLLAMQKAHDYDELRYLLLRFSTSPEIVCTSVFRPDIDFGGRYLMNLYDASADERSVTFALLPDEVGTVAVFAWLGAFPEAETFTQSLLDVPPDRLPTVLVRFMFEMFGEVWMRPDWWERLPGANTDFLIDRMSTANLPYPLEHPLVQERQRAAEPSFADPGFTLADWKLTGWVRHGAVCPASAPVMGGPDLAGPWKEFFARIQRRAGMLDETPKA